MPKIEPTFSPTSQAPDSFPPPRDAGKACHSVLQPARNLSSRLEALPGWPWIGLLFAATFLAYAPALSGELLWDDHFLVGGNPFFRSPLFLWEVFRHWLFPEAFAAYYRPVQNLSYLADYLVWRGNPFGYHCTNLLLHAGAASLLFLLLARLLPKALPKTSPGGGFSPRGIAFGVALVWVVHPVHNAAVAYIAGRADSLAALFALGGAWLFWRAAECRGRVPRAAGFTLAWLAGLLALCSKEIALTWVLLFAVAFLALLRREERLKAAAVLGAVAALVAAYGCLRHLPEARSAVPADQAPFSGRFLLMLRALGDYTRLIFWPGNLHMCRAVSSDGAYASARAWQQNIGYEYLSLLGAATLAAFAWGSRSRRPGLPLRRFGALWFLIGFLPISNLFPLNAQVAEHWIYMPSVGYLLFLAGCLAALPARWRRGAVFLLPVVLVGLGLRTRVRSGDWTSPQRFYWSTIQSGGADPRVLLNLAGASGERGGPAQAEQRFRAIVARWPAYAPAKTALGNWLIAHGRAAESEPLLREAGASGNAPLFAGTWEARLNLAKARLSQGRTNEARLLADQALAQNPEVERLVRFKAQLLQQSGQTAQAVAVLRDYTGRAWWSYGMHLLLGRLLWSQEEFDAALAAFAQAARLDVWAAEPLTLAAEIELSRKRPEAALDFAQRAMGRAPGLSQRLLLATVLQQLGRPAEAARVLEAMKGYHAPGGQLPPQPTP